MLQLLENWALIYFSPSYDRLNLIYLHGKSVFFGLQARFQIWYYLTISWQGLPLPGETLINNYLSMFRIVPAGRFNWQRSAADIAGPLLDLKWQPLVGDTGRWWIQVDSACHPIWSRVSSFLDTWILECLSSLGNDGTRIRGLKSVA